MMNKLTREQKLSLQRAAKAEMARRDYIEYCKYTIPNFKVGKHIKYIGNELTQFLNNSDKNILLVSLPPQNGKSTLITETLPSYCLGKSPDDRIILVSYGDDLARRFGRRNKQKIDEYGEELFNIKLNETARSDTDFEIKGHQGKVIARGIMAGLTGQAADLIIIDDPVKNREQADSETYREKVWDEFLNSILSRLSSKGKVIVIATRWHEDDLIGRIQQHMADQSIVINIPLEAEENDILGREPGDGLFPEIGKGRKWVQELKMNYTTSSGLSAWNALYQGRPTSAEGNMLKTHWWKFYTELPPRFDECFFSWDATFKESDTSDYVVGQLWGRVLNDYYLIDQVRGRMDFPTTIQVMRDFNGKYKHLAKYHVVEDKANGSAIISTLKKEFHIIAIVPKESKIARVSAVSYKIECGNVHLPKFAPFIDQFLDECKSFPKGVNDDSVDCMSQALNRFVSTSDKTPKEEPEHNTHDYVFEKAMKNYKQGRKKRHV
jgi:predicted phage terminase large subunit-like protein